MWLMTTRGFYSVVQHWDQPEMVLVRARCEADIRALAELMPGVEVVSTPDADYPWRVIVPATEWKQAVDRLLSEVDYPNFKSAVGSRSRMHEAAYHEIWSVLREHLDDRHRRG